VSKVAQELDNHLGVKDKTLAEFIISIAKHSSSDKDFFNNLQENDAEFTNGFATTLYNLIQKMMPQKLKDQHEPHHKKDDAKAPLISYQKSSQHETFEQSVDREDRNPELLKAKFPALAIPNNPNQEELKLDLDLEDTRTAPPSAKDNNNNNNANDDIDIGKKIAEKIKQRMANNNNNNNDTTTITTVKEVSKPVVQAKKEKDVSKSRSRSRSRDKKHRKHSHRDKDRDRGHSKSRSRSRSNDKYKNRHKSSRKRGGSKSRSHSMDRRNNAPEEVEIGRIFDGMVTNVHDFGAFVRLDGYFKGGKKEGLIHISNLSQNRVTNAFEHVKKNQKVKVKVIGITQNKISLSMKEVDQNTGQEVVLAQSKFGRDGERITNENANTSRRRNASAGASSAMDEEKKPKPMFGSLTGIRLEREETAVDNARRPVKRMTSPELWELSRISG
jgi:ATP-dependent RNA helicase DHX8/PRP22